MPDSVSCIAFPEPKITRRESVTVYPSQIYIVDDDLSFGRALKRLLNARGLAVDYFTSAQSFLDSVPPNRQGFVILDIQMPGCDGFMFLDRLHQMHYELPPIVMTGQTLSYARELAFEKGAVGFLLKPFNEDSLLEALTKAGEDAGEQGRPSIQATPSRPAVETREDCG